MSARIYVATHKKDDCLLKLNDSIYIPIHCGKAIYKDDGSAGYLPTLGDNTGDNISAKNPNYCELTAMYWAWKNDDSKPEDIIGLNHYRRYFSEPMDNMKLMTQQTMEEFLDRADFIVNGCGTDFDNTQSDEESAYNGYKRNHCIVDLNNALVGTAELFPELFKTINNQVKHSGAMALCNMLITKKKYFDEYCEYLFPVLNYVESKVDFTDDRHQGYGARVFGFLGERLFRPWLIATGHSGIQGPGLDWEKFSGYVWK